MFQRNIFGLCGHPNFLSRIMIIHFAEMMTKKQEIANDDKRKFDANTKGDTWKNLESHFKSLRPS